MPVFLGGDPAKQGTSASHGRRQTCFHHTAAAPPLMLAESSPLVTSNIKEVAFLVPGCRRQASGLLEDEGAVLGLILDW